jgi:SAM-dependent methyltransferase
MTASAKQTYYRDRAMPANLQATYFREFDGARRILDVGCGTGELARGRCSPEVKVFGVDIDTGALRQAARFEVVARVDLEWSLPYRDASFDAVLAKDIFEHLQHPGRLASEVVRVARPGGVVVVSVVMAKPRAVWADYTHVRGFTKHTATQLLEDAGLRVERVWRMGGVPLSSRLGLVWLVPTLLRLPGFSQLWSSSWELKARKPLGPDAEGGQGCPLAC